jgi:dUTP pyrophosphatase
MKVKVINLNPKNPLPKYETPDSAGMDLRANINTEYIVEPGERILIPTGLKMAIPSGYECQIRPRSGLALKKGITVLNTPGTIDASYRGEVGVIIINHSNDTFTINPGDRIAQAVFNKVEYVELEEVDELDETERGEGGFGHTGV